MSTSEILPTTYRGYTIREETDPWRRQRGELIVFFLDNEEKCFYELSVTDAKITIDDLIAEKEAKTEAFQTKDALTWLLAVLNYDKITTADLVAKAPHIGRYLPAEKDSLNYKWTQWAKQKIENLK